MQSLSSKTTVARTRLISWPKGWMAVTYISLANKPEAATPRPRPAHDGAAYMCEQ